MNLVFDAQEVSYNEALGGDIIQVVFQEYPNPDIDYSKSGHDLPLPVKSIMFSVNYEFPPCNITVEWCDGKDFDGGQLIKNIELTKTSLKVVLENKLEIEVTFKTDDINFKNIKNFLLNENN